jgi:hypothetical protein
MLEPTGFSTIYPQTRKDKDSQFINENTLFSIKNNDNSNILIM